MNATENLKLRALAQDNYAEFCKEIDQLRAEWTGMKSEVQVCHAENERLRADNDRLRKILLHVPVDVAIKAKHDAGFGGVIKAQAKELDQMRAEIERLRAENLMQAATINGLRLPQVGRKFEMTMEQAEAEIERLKAELYRMGKYISDHAQPNDKSWGWWESGCQKGVSDGTTRRRPYPPTRRTSDGENSFDERKMV